MRIKLFHCECSLLKSRVPSILILFIFASLFHQTNAKDFYVSPLGADINSGTLESPYANIAHAVSMVRAFKQSNPNEPITVYLRGGKYYLSEPISFDAEDSGTELGPVAYKAYGDEVPEILGGIKFDNLSWEKVDDHVYKTSVPDGLVFETLFVGGEKQILARYPNYDEDAEIFNGYAADCIDASKVSTWANPTGGYVHALHPNRWGGIHYRITSKSGTKLNLEGGTQNNRGSGMHGTYRFVENIFEELDDVNEWYLNRNTSVLYYYPPSNVDLSNVEVEVAALEQLIVLKGTEENPVQYLTFEGLTLKRTIRTFMKTADRLLRSDWCIYRGGVVHFEGTENCAIKDCELSGLGGNAIFFNAYNKNSSATECHIYDVGASGICFVGDVKSVWHENYDIGTPPDLATMSYERGAKTNNYPQYCVADNNLIHNIGTVEKQPAGVHISLSAYITVSRNSIYDVPRSGINISEGKYSGHILEYNDVFKTVLETHDHGAFNSWGRDRFYAKDRTVTNARVGEKGDALIQLDILDTTVIRNNRFRCDHGWDIDLDDGSSYYHVYNNVCLSGGIKLRDGYHRLVENNITINNSMHQHVWLENSGDIIRNNIFTHGYYPIGMGNWGTQLDSNLFFRQSDLENVQESYGVDKNSIFGDPLFVDAANGDFSIAKGSTALEIGFKNIPMQFGVQKPELKAIAETPEIPEIKLDPDVIIPGTDYWGGVIKNIETDGELSATGLGEMKGAMVMKSPDMWMYALVDLVVGDVVLKLDDEAIDNIDDLMNKLVSGSSYDTMFVWRYQEMIKISLPDLSSCAIPVELNSTKWELVSTDSEATGYEAIKAFDNNNSSFWHTVFDPSDEPYPHQIIVDMGAPYQLDYMQFLGRQGSNHPRIQDFELYVSSDLENWGDPVLEGTLANSSDLQNIKIKKENDGQYFKFVGLSGFSREAAAIAELDFQGACGSNVPLSPYEKKYQFEKYNTESGTSVNAATDIDDSEIITTLDNGDYVHFSNFNFEDADSLNIRVASATDNGVVEVRIASASGKIIAFIDVPNTGSLSNWVTVSAPLDKIEGANDIYFVFRGDGSNLYNLNWFQIRKHESLFSRLEAEEYSESSGSLITSISTDDADDDGKVLRYTKPGEWILFKDIDLSDVSSVNARYATSISDAKVEIRLDAVDGTQIGTIDLSSTGSWNRWETTGANLTATNGVHDVYFMYQSESNTIVCNSNWFQLSNAPIKASRNGLLRIEAEDFSRVSGLITKESSDIDGDQELSDVQAGDWVLYKSVDLNNAKTISLRVASANTGGRIEVRKDSYDGSFLSIVLIPNTGSATSWETVTANLYSTIDEETDVYFVFRGVSSDLANINWFKFNGSNTALKNTQTQNVIQLYPNPASQFVTINVDNNMPNKVDFINSVGAKVKTICLNESSRKIDVSTLSKGLYIVSCSHSGKVVDRKLFIKN